MIDDGTVRRHQAVFGALGAGVLGLAVVALTLAPVGGMSESAIEMLFYACAGGSVVAILAAFLIQQRVPEALVAAASAEERLDIVFRRNIITMAVLEMPAMAGLIGVLVTADQSFLAFILPFVVVLVVLFPTEGRLRGRIGL